VSTVVNAHLVRLERLRLFTLELVSRTPHSVRRPIYLLGILLCLLAVLEIRTSWFQSRVFTWLSGQMTYAVATVPAPRLPQAPAGPHDKRLGYAALPEWQKRLERNGYEVKAQAHASDLFLRATSLGIFPIYPEKNQAGLKILDRHGWPLHGQAFPGRIYRSFDEIPPVLIRSLLFVENRQLFSEHPWQNPAIEWERTGRALLDYWTGKVIPGHARTGGSTLATQLEKIRHSPNGRTSSMGEKLRQMLSASLRSYHDGEVTYEARRRIVRDYLNNLPLSAIAGYGEVNGLGDGLWAWYGADFDRVNELLAAPEPVLSAEQFAERAVAFRQALSLILAVRKPTAFLVEDPESLNRRTDSYLRLLAAEGVITPALRDAALKARPELRRRVEGIGPESFVERKASDSVRRTLLNLLGTESLYDLDRVDLTAHTTLDRRILGEVNEALRKASRSEEAQRLGLVGFRLLNPEQADSVIYSFTLYERGEEFNRLRAQTDSFNQPLNVNEQTKLELGSTAKLRTLVTYLEIVSELYARHGSQPVEELRRLAAATPKEDKLTLWALEYLAETPSRDLPSMLEAAMMRRYSAGTGERFFTGGGSHTFRNFDGADSGRIMTVREAFQRSVNLVFIRLMRDIVNYHIYRLPRVAPEIFTDPDHPQRKMWLERFADYEGRVFLSRFYQKYAGVPAGELRAKLLEGKKLRPQTLEAVFPPPGVPQLFNLNDRGYLAGIHPLEIWLVEYLERNPGASLEEVYRASRAERLEVYQWLFKKNRKHGQDLRIRTMLEQAAFQRIHESWKRQGYPFNSLVPSYATSIGSSADTPAALAELAGIILNDGIRKPSLRIEELHFAEGTPYETVMAPRPVRAERVMPVAVARLLRQELLGVVEHGTARRAFQSVKLADGKVVPVGGKTGTGDNRLEIYHRPGRLAGSRVMNRTAAFVFTIGDRFFGTVIAYVPGQEAASHRFTSSLPVQMFKVLAPSIRPLLEEEAGGGPIPLSGSSANTLQAAYRAPGAGSVQ
jgi:membrane peptidoglycan carboxypeptidase